MSPIQIMSNALRALPGPLRQFVYAVFAIVGVALGLCQVLDVTDLGPVTLAQALQVYAYLAPISGVLAVANVNQPDTEQVDFDEDADLSSFEPVGDVEDVYDATPA